MNIELWNRRLVIIATDTKIESLEHSEDGRALLNNQQLQIISVKESEDFDKTYTILGGLRPQPGMLLMLSPYDDLTYVDVEDARTMIAVEKAALISRFCALLGAKSVKVTNIKIVDNEKEKEISLNAQYSSVTGDIKIKNSQIMNLKNQVNINAEFSGGEPNFIRADSLLKSSRLNTDPFLKNLLEMAKDFEATNNKTLKIEQEVSLTQSLQNTFDLISNLDFPGGVIAGNYKATAKEKIEIYFSLNILF